MDFVDCVKISFAEIKKMIEFSEHPDIGLKYSFHVLFDVITTDTVSKSRTFFFVTFLKEWKTLWEDQDLNFIMEEFIGAFPSLFSFFEISCR
jgi:hypothetical protein